MTKSKITRWDPADYLKNDTAMIAYLEAALEDGDPEVVTAALGDLARAKGMTRISEETGLGRESLYKSLSRNGNPELSTVLRVAKALGLRLHVSLATPKQRRRIARG